MSEYVNGLQINITEVVTLDFRENSQNSNISIAKVTMLYEALKGFHELIGNTIIQHDAKLAEVASNKKLTN